MTDGVIVYEYQAANESDGISDIKVAVTKFGLVDISQGGTDMVTLLVPELFDICRAVNLHYEKRGES